MKKGCMGCLVVFVGIFLTLFGIGFFGTYMEERDQKQKAENLQRRHRYYNRIIP